MDSVSEETPSNMEDESYMFKRRPASARRAVRSTSRAGRRAVRSTSRAGRRAVRSARRLG